MKGQTVKVTRVTPTSHHLPGYDCRSCYDPINDAVAVFCNRCEAMMHESCGNGNVNEYVKAVSPIRYNGLTHCCR